MQFIELWSISTFVVFLVRYFPEQPFMDFAWIAKTFGWGLFWAAIIDLFLIVVMSIFAYFVSKK